MVFKKVRATYATMHCMTWPVGVLVLVEESEEEGVTAAAGEESGEEVLAVSTSSRTLILQPRFK